MRPKAEWAIIDSESIGARGIIVKYFIWTLECEIVKNILRLGSRLATGIVFHLIDWVTTLNERVRVDHTCQSN